MTNFFIEFLISFAQLWVFALGRVLYPDLPE